MERLFAKKIDSLDAIFDYITQFANANKVNPEITRKLHFGVEEVFTNMVRYNTESANDVAIGLQIDNGQFLISIVDRDVHSYDPTKRPPVDIAQPLHERTPGGLGIHLVREMMDDVRYEYDGRTATITLIKRLER
jgi:anti-sigma regulatory factor (Ser/Thr protein kinase)